MIDLFHLQVSFVSVPPRLDMDVDDVNIIIRETCQALGCNFLRLDIPRDRSLFKRNDAIHLSFDSGLPALIENLFATIRPTIRPEEASTTELPNNREKKRRWFQGILKLRRNNYEARKKKRNEMAKEGERERRERWEQRQEERRHTKNLKRRRRYKEKRRHGNYLQTDVICKHNKHVLFGSEVKGNVQSLSSIPNFFRILHFLRVMSSAVSALHAQYDDDVKGIDHFLSLEDLQNIYLVYIFNLAFILISMMHHLKDGCSQNRCAGGGNAQNNNDSNLIRLREKSKVSDLIKFPSLSECCDSYSIVPISFQETDVDIMHISKIPPLSICKKMLTDLDKLNEDSMCAQASDGTSFTKNMLVTILSYRDEIRAKNEIILEKEWLRIFKNGHFISPPGLSVEANVEYVEQALNYMHGDLNGDDNASYGGLTLGNIRGIVTNNYITDDFLAHFSCNINSQSSTDSFCFFYDRMNLDTYEVSGTVMDDFKKSGKHAITKLLVFCRVKNVVLKDQPGFTHIGDFATDQNEILAADHYVMLVFDTELLKVTYCDSLGWKAPSDLSLFISCISHAFFDNQEFSNISFAHNPSNSANSREHTCTDGLCAKYFPLQKCGSACGVAVSISAAIAMLDFDSFRKIVSIDDSSIEIFTHLKDISTYSAFFRSVLLKWLKKDISINDIIPISSPIDLLNIVPPNSSFNNFDQQKAQNIYTNIVTENEFMIPLSQENKDLLSNDSDLSLIMLSTKYFDGCQNKSNCQEKAHFHCKLCNSKAISSKSASKHFNSVHKKNGVEWESHFYFACSTNSHVNNDTNRSHYHCGYCDKIVAQRNRFQQHLKSHQKREKRKRENDMFEFKELIDQPPTKKNQVEKDVQCPICDKVLLGSSLKRHMKTHDKIMTPESITVDRHRGIYMVPKSPNHGGIRYPVHVQKYISKHESNVFCEHPECMVHHKLYRDSGGTLINCAHLKLVNDQTTLIKEPEILNEDFLYEEGGPFAKTWKEETIKNCSELNRLAILGNFPPVVPFFPNGSYLHLSVWTSNEDPCGKLGRIILTYDKKTCKISCGCSLQNRIPCVHKAMALWYLYQTGAIPANHEITSNFSNNTDISTSAVVENEPTQNTNTNASERDHRSSFYPPKKSEDLERMIDYWHSHKKYTKGDLETINDFRTKLPDKKIIPSETKCIECDVSLKPPVRVNKNGKVLSFSNGLDGQYSVYVKQCPSCEMFYRYQDCTDGIHNIDDDLFVEIRILMFLKENLQEQNSVGGAVKSLSRLPGMTKKLDEAKILDGYLMYDVLSTNDHPFFCAQCGYHPHILVADLNRKVAFQCDHDSVEDVDDTDDETAGDVDCDKYWKYVECNILAGAFPGSVKTKFSVKPSYKFWSPYMGKNTRKSNILLNTEYKKLNRKTGTYDSEYLKELSTERLHELVSQKPLRVLKNIAKDMKMTHLTGKNRREILSEIVKHISGDNESFAKLFLNMGGFSGGYLTYNCIHGITYYVKMPIRAEGPRDYIDGFLSMQHPPNVTIIDMPQLLVQHSRSRENDILRTNSGNDEGELFFPFEGRAGDANNQKIMQEANENRFKTSFPCLSGETSDKIQVISALSHPVTGSSMRLALFDRLHENNSNSKIEDLRKLQCVKELYGQLNSQVAEQLHKSFNTNKRFLNAMSPHRFAYLLRSLLNHRNELRNEAFIENQKIKGYEIYRNHLGKIQLKLGFDKSFVNNPSNSNSIIHDVNNPSPDNVDFLISEVDQSEESTALVGSDANGINSLGDIWDGKMQPGFSVRGRFFCRNVILGV